MYRMRKLMYLIAGLLLSGQAFSADGVTVSAVTVEQGGTADVEVSLSSATSLYKGFQFDLQLPSCVTPVQDEKDRLVLTRGSRISDVEEYNLSSNLLSTGVVRVICTAPYATPIAAGDDVLVKVSVSAGSDAETGEYTGTLSGIEFNTSDNVRTLFDAVEFKVSVIAPVDKTVRLDETSSSVPSASDGAVDIHVKRSIAGGQWNTLCLPFDMTEAQLKECFGSDVALAEFSSYDVEYDSDDNVSSIVVNFVDTDLTEGLYGNYPYLVKTSGDISEFTLTSTVSPDEENATAEYDNGKKGKQREVYGTFQGTLHAGGLVPANGLFISGDKFWYSTGSTSIKGFRGYFVFTDVIDLGSASVKMYVGGEATGVGDLEPATQAESIYDLSGRKVSKTGKGIYIVNGRKVLK